MIIDFNRGDFSYLINEGLKSNSREVRKFINELFVIVGWTKAGEVKAFSYIGIQKRLYVISYS